LPRSNSASPYHGPPVGESSERAIAHELLIDRVSGLSREVLAAAHALFPVRVPGNWASRMEPDWGPISRQALPHEMELTPHRGDVTDPVGERYVRPLPLVVHKHPDRVLILVTRACHMYCRYCFRRDQHLGAPRPDELDAAVAYARDSGAQEVILSGGDPLVLSDRKLFALIDAVRPQVPVVRVHTRAPITAPGRVTRALAEGLADRRPVWVVVHANHPDELSEDVCAALAILLDAGVPVLNQSVLLAGVNDDPDVLAALSVALVAQRVFPYYLHHPDPVPGNAGFRLSLERGLRIYRALSERVSGVGLPRYVVDPPDGSGKIDVERFVSVRDSIPSRRR
jgi:lysine 2,3-aminomutase